MKLAVYTHLWLACIAMLLAWECMLLFPFIYQSFYSCLFAASATLFVYNAHTLAMCYIKNIKSELSVWCHKNTFLISAISLLGMMASLYFIVFHFSIYQHLLLLFVIVCCMVYECNVIWSASIKFPVLQKLPFLKSVILATVWIVITTLLPISENGFQWIQDIQCVLFVLIRFLTCMLVAILFDLRDVSSDNKTTVKTIPNTLGITATAYVWYAITLVILLLLAYMEVHSYFILVRIFQIALLLFFFRTRNSMTFGASMLLWDGVLIISPLTGLLLFSL